jgi:hypothetical protein
MTHEVTTEQPEANQQDSFQTEWKRVLALMKTSIAMGMATHA